MHRVLHRLLSGSAAALLAAAVVTAAGTPALAAEPSLRLHFPDLSVVGKTPKSSPLFTWIDVPGTSPVLVKTLTVTVETAGVADIATVAVGEEFSDDEETCRRQGTVISCVFGGEAGQLDPGSLLLPLVGLDVTAKPGAAEGATGKLTFRAQLDDGPVGTGASTVTIGQGVDLAGVIAKPVTVAPGASAAADIRVSNTGKAPVKGVKLLMAGWDKTLVEGAGFSNCTYGELVVCTFTDDLATGTTYELSKPMRLRIPGDAAAGSRASAIGSWYTTSDFEELLDSAPEIDGEIFGKPGTGAPVTLRAVPVKGALKAAGQVDTNFDNNLVISEFVVGGRKLPDTAAVGATVTGAAGDQVQAKVGFVNNGPGTLYHWTFDNNDIGTHVVVPAGLRAVDFDQRCSLLFPADTDPEEEFDEDDIREFYCFSDEGKTKAGQSGLFAFTFQVREDASAAAGRVRINEEDSDGEDILDRDRGNNTAAITVKLTGGGEGGGGGLPVTGANAGLIGAAGGVLLLGGALGLLLVRRRRVRFTA